MIPAKLQTDKISKSEIVGYTKASISGVTGELMLLSHTTSETRCFCLFSPHDTDQISIVLSAEKGHIPAGIDVDLNSVVSRTVGEVAIRISSDIVRFVATGETTYEDRVIALRSVLKSLTG